MQLLNLDITGSESLRHIRVAGEKIAAVSTGNDFSKTKDELSLHFKNALAFPGLINSHDHLDFDLFSQTGHKKYNNYVEWGANLHTEHRDEIDAVLKIPLAIRARWGVYKNLLAGVTTVVNHGEKLPVETGLLTVFQECRSIHSVRRGKHWKFHLNKWGLRKRPVVIHIGEGTDEAAYEEIDRLIRWNYFKRPVIGVHAVAMDARQAASFRALIWCPASNYFMFDRTAPVDMLKQSTMLLFGSDSTLTASWNIWEQLRLARSLRIVSDSELFDMLTINAASTWGLKNNGRLAEGQYADIVVSRPPKNNRGWDAFYNVNPEDILLVLHRGNIRLFDEELLEQLKSPLFQMENYSPVYINGAVKYVQGNIGGLVKEIHKYNPHINLPITCER